MKNYFGILFLFVFVFFSLLPINSNAQSSCVSLPNNLKERDQNNEVKSLQSFLKQKGYLYTEPTGFFGTLTTKAVIDFQKANNINPAVGYVGAVTRAKIQSLDCELEINEGVQSSNVNSTEPGFLKLRPGTEKKVCTNLKNNFKIGSRDTNTNGEVSILQEFLNKNFYFDSQPTGYFGNQTEKAVIAFQKDYNITPSVGYIGPTTRLQIKSYTCDEAQSKEVDFFHDRYVALSKEFKEPQTVYRYAAGRIILGVEDTDTEAGKPIPGKRRNILLGFALRDYPFNSHKAWEDEPNNSVKGKSVKIVLPDEATFKESYGCDGSYQGCIYNYPERMPETESFYAKVYLGGKLLNDDYTEEEQNFAKKGENVMVYQTRLYDTYNSYLERFKFAQKVSSVYVGDNTYLTLENTNKVYPPGIGVDYDVFSEPISVKLKDSIPYSSNLPIQEERIEKFFDDYVVGRNIKITLPDFSELQSLNQDLDNPKQQLSPQFGVQAYIEGQNQSLIDQLKAFIK